MHLILEFRGPKWSKNMQSYAKKYAKKSKKKVR